MADEAAVRERLVAGVPRATRRSRARPANPNTFTGPDTNSTALAVQGLAAWGKSPAQTLGAAARCARDPVERRRLPVHRARRVRLPTRTRPRSRSRRSSPRAARRARRSGGRERARRTPRSLGTSSVARAPASARSCSPEAPAANVFATVQSVPAMAGKKLPVAVVDEVGDRSAQALLSVGTATR